MSTSVPSFHPHTFTFYSPLHIPSLLFLWLIQPVGITLIIQKVTCGLLLSPLLRREEENGKGKKKPEGVSVLMFSFLAIIFFPSTSWCGELIFFIHYGEKGATDHSAAEIVRQSVTLSQGHDKNNRSDRSILMKIVVRLNYLICLNV